MSPKKIADFEKWYNGVKNDVFDFNIEFKKYCLADVELLAKAILTFRHIVKKHVLTHARKSHVSPRV